MLVHEGLGIVFGTITPQLTDDPPRRWRTYHTDLYCQRGVDPNVPIGDVAATVQKPIRAAEVAHPRKS